MTDRVKQPTKRSAKSPPEAKIGRATTRNPEEFSESTRARARPTPKSADRAYRNQLQQGRRHNSLRVDLYLDAYNGTDCLPAVRTGLDAWPNLPLSEVLRRLIAAGGKALEDEMDRRSEACPEALEEQFRDAMRSLLSVQKEA